MNLRRLDRRLLIAAMALVPLLSILAQWLTPADRPGRSAEAIAPTAAVTGDGFQPDGVYPTTPIDTHFARLRRYGSWRGSDEATGAAASDWMPAAQSFHLLVAGYPNLPGNSLVVEIEDALGRVTRLQPHVPDAGERWQPVLVTLPAERDARRMRLVAADETRQFRGWFGFSEPFQLATSPADGLRQAWDMLRLLLLAASAAVLFFGPGLALRAWARARLGRELPFAAVPLAGPVVMAAIGLAIWAAGGLVAPALAATAAVAALAIGQAIVLQRYADGDLITPVERRAFAVIGLVILVAIGKATLSIGPLGELYGGTISRTLEVGFRADSRVAFHTVQLVAHSLAPGSETARSYYSPWQFSSRGPLAGLAAAPFVLAAHADVPITAPNQPWEPLDPHGFAAYRVAMIVMAAGALLVLFGVVAGIAGPHWGYLGLLLAATTPFLVHEVYFTWPKLQAAAFVLFGGWLIAQRRPGMAGAMLGLGYLFHPLALLSAPAIAGLILMTAWRHVGAANSFHPRPLLRDAVTNGLVLALGMSPFLMVWWLANWNEFTQTKFLGYALMANSLEPGGPGEWLAARVRSLWNTLVPLHLVLTDSGHRSVNDMTGRSPGIVTFFFQYWNTLPFGIGIIHFPVLLLALASMARRRPFQLIFLVALPFGTFLAYWGMSPTGLLREGLHVWVLTLVYAVALCASIPGTMLNRGIGLLCGLAALRTVEIGAMLLVPSLATGNLSSLRILPVNDALSLALMLFGLVLLAAELWRFTRHAAAQRSAGPAHPC